jgi:phosphodiesterase/alkaline phosphatase D-like protein
MVSNDLPKVRRALANVPVYMMLDDHEVTDDWNLNPMWKDRVYTNPLGKTVLRNGILAYGLFQGWGNDPEYFETRGGTSDTSRAAVSYGSHNSPDQ